MESGIGDDRLAVMTMIVAVADPGNISRAAEVVHRSQSAVGMQIRTLEAALGKPLFVRRPRGVSLAQDGEVLLSFARRMLALRDEAWAAVVRPDMTGRVEGSMRGMAVSHEKPPALRAALEFDVEAERAGQVCWPERGQCGNSHCHDRPHANLPHAGLDAGP